MLLLPLLLVVVVVGVVMVVVVVVVALGVHTFEVGVEGVKNMFLVKGSNQL